VQLVRVLISVLLAVLFASFCHAAPQPITADQLGLMLRSGLPVQEIERDLAKQGFSGEIDDAAARKLLDSGATPQFLTGLKARLAGAAQRWPGTKGFPPSPYVTRQQTVLDRPAAKWPHRNEEHWLIDRIVRDIAEIVAFAKSSGDSSPVIEILENDGTAFRLRAEQGGVTIEQRFELKHHLWSAETFAAVAGVLLQGWAKDAARPAGVRDVALLPALATGDMTAVVRQSKRISERLTQRPLDAELHENAALIAASLALREAAGDFADARVALSRTTAHLALARALRKQEGESGTIARAIVSALVGRQQEAVNSTSSLAGSGSLWKSAVQLRATGDWRKVSAPGKASGIEQKELFRALRRAGAAEKSVELLQQLRAPQSADWNRLAMETGLSVQHGHAFAAGSLPLEMMAFAASYQAFHGGQPREAELVPLLNREPERAVVRPINGKPQIEVLGWGHFAAFHQRHICHSLSETLVFVGRSLGLTKDAATVEAEISELLDGMTLLPFARLSAIETPSQRPPELLAAAAKVAQSHPQMITAAAWMPGTLTDDAFRWFVPQLPFGTLYELADRSRTVAPNIYLVLGPQFWTGAALEMAPWHTAVKRSAVFAKFGNDPTAEQVAAIASTLGEFNLFIMRDIAAASKNDAKAYRAVMERIAAIEPNSYVDLAQHLQRHGTPEEAAAASQLAFDKASDRVAVSNHMLWLVEHYLQQGRTADAEKIARDCGRSYSSAGLATLALFLEKTGQHDEAESYYKKIKERYGTGDELLAFYTRNKNARPEYARAAEAGMAALFPDGYQRVQLGDLHGPPAQGVIISSSSSRVAQAGLKPGDIIVGIEGVHVRSVDQYLYLREQARDLPMTLIVWTGAQYREARVDVPQRRLNCTINTLGSGR
jgi:hypothetical protein